MRCRFHLSNLSTLLLLMIMILPTLVGCSVPFAASCADQSTEFLSVIDSLARDWDDANKLAGRTPRMGLAVQVQNLQAIKRKAQDLKPPECALAVQTHLVTSMEHTIQGYLDFMSQKDAKMVSESFDKATTALLEYAKARGEVMGVNQTTK